MKEILDAIDSQFNINGWLFLVPIAVIALIVKKVPAIPAILAGAVLGGIFALIFQPDVVLIASGSDFYNWEAAYVGVMTSFYGNVSIATGNAIVDDLLSSSQMYGMLECLVNCICNDVWWGNKNLECLKRIKLKPLFIYG